MRFGAVEMIGGSEPICYESLFDDVQKDNKILRKRIERLLILLESARFTIVNAEAHYHDCGLSAYAGKCSDWIESHDRMEDTI